VKTILPRLAPSQRDALARKLTPGTLLVLALAVLGTCGRAAMAEEPDTPAAPVVHGGSLFRQEQAAPAPLDNGEPHKHSRVAGISFFAVDEPKIKKFKKHDLITVVINEQSDSTTTGLANNEKKQDFDLALQQFAALNNNGSILPTLTSVANPSSLPEVKFKYDNNRQNNAQQQRSDQLTARIQAEVVDVKPNGNMVLEATKRIVQDKETQTFLLTGEARAEDVGLDNSVLSTQVAKLTLSKMTDGDVHNATRSGWFNSILDKVNPF